MSQRHRALTWIEDARSAAATHPRGSLNDARRAAEAICVELIERSGLDMPGRINLAQMITTIEKQPASPKEIIAPLKAIQAYGNHGSHDSKDEIVNSQYVQPVLGALDTLQTWFELFLSSDTSFLPRTTPPQNLAALKVERSPRLVGRDSEILKLQTIVKSVLGNPSQGGRAVLLGGGSGSGKTALAEACQVYAADLGALIATAACESFHEGMSFFPIRELLRQLSNPKGSLVDLVEAFGPRSSQVEIARLAENTQADPAARRDALVATFVNTIFARSAITGKPVVLFIDDLERLDTASADAILCLVRRLREGPAFLIGAYRTDILALEGQSAHCIRPLLNAVRKSDYSEHIEVNSIQEGNTSQLVACFLGGAHNLPIPFLSKLHDETDGNPLYIRESLRILTETRDGRDQPPLRLVNGVWCLDRLTNGWSIPRTLDDAISSRLLSLSEDDRRVLELAAAIGKRFSFDVLIETDVLCEETLITSIEKYLQASILREVASHDGLLEFTHGRIRDVIYASISGLRRARLHNQLADIFIKRPNLVAREEAEVYIGSHLYFARRYSEAGPMLLRAAEGCLEVHSALDASKHAQRSLDSFEKADVPSSADQARLILGRCLLATGDFVAAEGQFELLCRAALDSRVVRWAWNFLGDISSARGQFHEALARYSKCKELAEDSSDVELLADTYADLAEMYMRQFEAMAGIDPEQARSHEILYDKFLTEELLLAEQTEDKQIRGRALRNSAKRARAQGRIDEALSLYERATQFAPAGSHAHQFFIPYAKALRLVGKYESAILVVQRVLEWSRQVGARRSEGIARQYLGLIQLEESLSEAPNATGISSARAEMEKALALHQEVGFEQGRRETEVDLAELCLHSGDPTQALSRLRSALSEPVRSLSDADLVRAVTGQLAANGERVRAARFAQAARAAGVDLDLQGSP